MRPRLLRALAAPALLAAALLVHAEGAPPASQAEFQAASTAAHAAEVRGPASLALGDQAHLALPEGYVYIPASEGARLMRAMGNQPGPDFMGLVLHGEMAGLVAIAFERAGYVRDDDARDWNADDLLGQLKEGTEAGNPQRRERGIPEFVVGRWIEAPYYDAGTHRLVWSAEVRDKYPAADATVGVNYNTYQLGREGYISMNLITDLDRVDHQKPHAHRLLGALAFNAGKRYSDFDPSSDRVAAYGLAALVGGVAAKKLGLLAAFGVFLAKFWKIAAIGLLGLGAVAKKVLARRNG